MGVLIGVGLIVALVAFVVIASALQPRPPDDLSEAHIRLALQQGDRLTAIRWYRVLHGVGLRRAKEGINALLAQESSSDKTHGE